MKKQLLYIFVLFACYAGIQNVAISGSAGKQLYAQCSGCHSVSYHRTGPKHCNLLGRRTGTVAGFEFSKAMQNSNIIWTKETLDAFLKAPLVMIPETTMGFSGISSDIQRAELIQYLTSLTESNPLCR